MDQDIIQQTLFTEDFNMKGKRLVVNIVSIMIMISILIFIYIAIVPISYFIRPIHEGRRNISGFYAEEKNTHDIIYIGGSAVYTYWQPLRAYNDYGFTSYNFTVSNINAQSIKYYIKEAQKTQNPKTWIVDLRPFQYGDNKYFTEERTVRFVTDSLNYSKNRNELIRASVKNKSSRFSFYVDFLNYKNRLPRVMLDYLLGKDTTPKYFIDNMHKNNLKGFYYYLNVYEISSFIDYSNITEELMIDKETNNVFIDLLDFCKEEDLNVLFIVHAYIQQEEHKKEYNYMKRVIEEYGFDFLNINDFYDEMNLDYQMDMYDDNHVNCIGAEIYTDFLAKYLKNNYDLPDHRADENFKEWSDLYPGFVEEMSAAKAEIIKLKNEFNQNANN